MRFGETLRLDVTHLYREAKGSDRLVKVNVAGKFPSKLRHCLSYMYYDVISFISTTFVVVVPIKILHEHFSFRADCSISW